MKNTRNNSFINILFVLAILNFSVVISFSQPIIADHTFVNAYDSIPQQYIDLIKNR